MRYINSVLGVVFFLNFLSSFVPPLLKLPVFCIHQTNDDSFIVISGSPAEGAVSKHKQSDVVRPFIMR